MIRSYASLAELRSAWLATASRSEGYAGAAWYNGETRDDTIRLTASGDQTLVPEAERLLAQLDAVLETPRRTWERAPAGAFACVPDVLAGLPTPMRRQVPTNDERAPINILVVTTSSAGVSAATLRKRGTVVLALAMALSRLRPVNLETIAMLDGGGTGGRYGRYASRGDGTGETVLLTRINTTPLDLATACYMLTSSGFDRRVTHDLARGLNGFTGGWPRGFNHSSPSRYHDALVLRLGYDPKDTLIVGASHVRDTLLSDPVAWVQAQINHFVNVQAEATP